jgi:hypothetical protein
VPATRPHAGSPGLLRPWRRCIQPDAAGGGLSGYVTEDELRSFFQGFAEFARADSPAGPAAVSKWHGMITFLLFCYHCLTC